LRTTLSIDYQLYLLQYIKYLHNIGRSLRFNGFTLIKNGIAPDFLYKAFVFIFQAQVILFNYIL